MTVGVGNTRFTRDAYMLAVRMLADNYRYAQIVRAVHEQFPFHRPDGDAPVTYRMVWRLAHDRKEEVEKLRAELNKNCSDLWIANKRQRLVALQEIYEDCNRWVPKKLIESAASRRDDHHGQAAGGSQNILVYEKDVTGMLSALRQAREELGVTPADRAADSLADLVRLAEEQRGLKRTTTIDAHPTDAVDYLEEATMLELPAPDRSKGDDLRRGFLDGQQGVVGFPELQARQGGDDEHPQGTEKKHPHP